MGKICKKCGYERSLFDNAPDYECPKCGAVYAKVEAYLARQAIENTRAEEKKQTEDNNNGLRESEQGPRKGFCPECGKEISTEAKSCPNCGLPNPTGKPNLSPVSGREKQGKKNGAKGLLKLFFYIMGIGVAASIVLPIVGGKPSRPPVTSSTPTPSSDDVCRDIGDNIAKVYFLNINEMLKADLLASQMMNEGCQKKLGSEGEECVKFCQDGFKYRAKQYLKSGTSGLGF